MESWEVGTLGATEDTRGHREGQGGKSVRIARGVFRRSRVGILLVEGIGFTGWRLKATLMLVAKTMSKPKVLRLRAMVLSRVLVECCAHTGCPFCAAALALILSGCAASPELTGYPVNTPKYHSENKVCFLRDMGDEGHSAQLSPSRIAPKSLIPEVRVLDNLGGDRSALSARGSSGCTSGFET